MILGFNHNIVYKGIVFHVQTEDSGVGIPHIITLLYQGGVILSSIKTSYADIVGMENLEQVVEELMKEQHKQMMRRLKSGEFDDRAFAGQEPVENKGTDADEDVDEDADTGAPPERALSEQVAVDSDMVPGHEGVEAVTEDKEPAVVEPVTAVEETECSELATAYAEAAGCGSDVITETVVVPEPVAVAEEPEPPESTEVVVETAPVEPATIMAEPAPAVEPVVVMEEPVDTVSGMERAVLEFFGIQQ